MKKSKIIFCLCLVMTSSQKKYLNVLENLNTVKFIHVFMAFLAIAKALPVRKGYRRDVTGERLLARSIAMQCSKTDPLRRFNNAMTTIKLSGISTYLGLL